uniref:RNA polymerase sigma-70 factor n=3 Tax=unclassified Prevotella TaxID=2638335 RepID=A0AB33J0Y8_9BACT
MINRIFVEIKIPLDETNQAIGYSIITSPKGMEHTERLIIEQLRRGEEAAYRHLYEHHYAVLCRVAMQYVDDRFLAETIVGDVIFHLWEIRESLSITSSLRQYLARSVRYQCLDYLKSSYNRKEIHVSGVSSVDMPVLGYLQSDQYPLGRLLAQELEGEIQKAIARLPADCRRVFRMSRMEQKSYEEIARSLGISENTVKYHMKRALAQLRDDLHKYLLSAIALLFMQF